MANEIDRELSAKYCPRFGQIAVDMGYVADADVKAALSEQIDDDLAGRAHRLIGRIFLDKGLMSPTQIDTVMHELFRTEEVC